jgi:hypothetical protein
MADDAAAFSQSAPRVLPMTFPTFIVAGAPKAGTHSMYDYLRKHPEVFMPSIKEPRFFAFRGARDRLRYPIETLEEYAALFRDTKGAKAIGEASSVYMASPVAAERIRALIPDVKLIFSLREPVQRTFSIYHMNLRARGTNEGKDFLQAMASDHMLRRKYHECLAPFFEKFPRENIKIILFESLSDSTEETVRSLYDFIGVRTDFLPDLKVSNPGGVPRSKVLHRIMSNDRLRLAARTLFPEAAIERLKSMRNRNLVRDRMVMTEKERATAYAFFEEDILRTQDLVGIDLSHWLQPTSTLRREAALS